MKGRLTICRTTSNMRGDYITLRVKDDSSAIGIIELQVELEDMMKALTGLSEVGCDIVKVVNNKQVSNLGKLLIADTVYCKKIPFTLDGKESQKDEVLRDFREKYQGDGWELNYDGTSSRQDGREHHYHIRKYIEK